VRHANFLQCEKNISSSYAFVKAFIWKNDHVCQVHCYVLTHFYH
jgi:hypothetical protein